MKPPPPTAAAIQRAKRKQTSRWLAAFVLLPLGVWFVAGFSRGFEGKSLSNFSLEPLLVIVASCLVFFAWTLVARRGPKPLAGIILLLLLSAGAFAVQHFVPGLRE
jgi:glucan phosphoethanolaminetransferase (alkaline phosphatase superfamily)